jgi:hypothetical protein
MTRVVPRLVCERFGRYVVVERDDRRRVRYRTGTRWSPRLREARLYHDMADVEAVISRFQPPTFWN